MADSLALLPLLVLLATALLLYVRIPAYTLRHALLAAALLSAAYLILATESLSLFHALRFLPILLTWLLPLAPLLFLLLKKKSLPKPSASMPRAQPTLASPTPMQNFSKFKFLPRPQLPRSFPQYLLTLFNSLLLLSLLLILAMTFCQALLAGPSNGDSLDYHLPRQLFWLQHASIAHYPTTNLRQLAMPPLTEYAGLHLLLLTGDDHAHNFIQWFAYLFTMLAASLITKKYNGSTTAQLFAALFVAIIPQAFLEAPITKNDVAIALWSCLITLYIFELIPQRTSKPSSENPHSRPPIPKSPSPLPPAESVPASVQVCGTPPSPPFYPRIILLGLAFAVFLFTKGTAYIFSIPLALFTAVTLLRFHPKKSLPALALISLLALTLNAPFLYRNYKAFGSPIPDRPGIHNDQSMALENHSPAALASNLLRNFCQHLVVPFSDDMLRPLSPKLADSAQDWDDNLTLFVINMHKKIHMDVCDPQTTWLGVDRYFTFRAYNLDAQDNESHAVAPMPLYMTLLLPIPFLIGWRKFPYAPIFILLTIVTLQFLLFCLLLKWQFWHVRVIILLPAMLAPVIAWAWTNPRTIYASPLIAALLLLSLYPSLNSLYRPLWHEPGEPNHSVFHFPYDSSRYAVWPELESTTKSLAKQIIARHPKVIAFDTGIASHEYNLQRLLLRNISPPPLFTNLNPSLTIPNYPDPIPDLIIAFETNDDTLTHNASHTRYLLVTNDDPYTLYMKDPAQALHLRP